MSLGERVREEREAKGWSQAEVARRVSVVLRRKVTQVAIHHIEKRGNVEPRFAVELASVLGVSLEWLRKGRGSKAPPANENGSSSAILRTQIGEKVPMPTGDKNLTPIVIYRTARADGGRMGGFMLHAREAGETERPDFLRFSKKAFAIQILDSSYTRMYRKRDVLLIDPEDDLTEGEDCLFTPGPVASNGVLCVIASLIRSTDDLWIVQQGDDQPELELKKADFKQAWPIVGVHRRRS